MGSTIKEQLWYGDHWIDVDLPERTRVLRANGHSSAKPVANLEASIREAIANPIAHDPIHKLVGKGAKVTIAFDDPGGVQTKGVDFRQVAISVLLEELQKAGVELSDILLLCANALHRKWTSSTSTSPTSPSAAAGNPSPSASVPSAASGTTTGPSPSPPASP